MKQALIATTAILLTAGTAMAAPYKHKPWHGGHGKGVSPYERVQIQKARANLASIKARAWRDGRVTFLERYQIRSAETRLARLISRAHRT